MSSELELPISFSHWSKLLPSAHSRGGTGNMEPEWYWRITTVPGIPQPTLLAPGDMGRSRALYPKIAALLQRKGQWRANP